MTDTTPKFDPIPRLQQIAATIRESGADIFDAPNTAVHYINCAIKEIERLRRDLDGSQLAYRGASYDRDRLRAERDDARWRLCKVLGDIRDVWGDEIAIEKGWRFDEKEQNV